MRIGFMIGLGILALLLGEPARGSGQVRTGDTRIAMPVLVTVDAEGKASSITPAYRLRPDMQRLIDDAVHKMVDGPAYEGGKPSASQVVIKLVLVARPLDADTYSLRIDNAGVEALPYGIWRWTRDNQNRLRLIDNLAPLRGDPQQRRLSTQIQNIYNPRPHESY